MLVLRLELGLAALAAEVDRLAVVSTDGVLATAATVMPQIGSTASAAAPGASALATAPDGSPVAARPVPADRHDLRQDRERDLGGRARADVEPAGTSMRASSSSGTPSPRSSASTPVPRFGLATSPT